MSPASERPTETKVSIALPCAGVSGLTGAIGCVSGRKDHQMPTGSSGEAVVARQRMASADEEKRMAGRVEGSSGASVAETVGRFWRGGEESFRIGLADWRRMRTMCGMCHTDAV